MTEEDIANRNTSQQGNYSTSVLQNCISIYTGCLDVLFFVYGNNQFLGDLNTALQHIKDELTQIKQEMREEHITTRNTSVQGKHARSFVVHTVTEPRGKSNFKKVLNAL